jgi:hypothetical protein
MASRQTGTFSWWFFLAMIGGLSKEYRLGFSKDDKLQLRVKSSLLLIRNYPAKL